jgi:hypothetical protein
MTATLLRTSRAACLIALLGALAPSAAADTLKVPVPFATIQEAVDAADEGDVIVVRKGTYEPFAVSGLNMLTLKGQGRPTIVVDGPIDDGGEGDGIQVVASNDILIKGFVVTGAGNTGIAVSSCNDVTIQACRVEQFEGSSAFSSASSNRVLFSKVRATDVGGKGVNLSSSTDVTVDRSRITGTEDDGIHCASSGGVLVSGTRITDAGDDGLHASSGGGPDHDVTLERTRLSDLGDDGVQTSGTTTDLTLTSVRIDRAEDRGLDHGGRDLTTTKLTIKATGDHGVRVEPVSQVGPGKESEGGPDPASVVMVTTKVINSGGSGLHLEADDAQVDGLVIKGTGQNALVIAGCTGASVSSARISNTTSTGAHFNFAQGCTLETVKLSKCDNGVRLDLNSADNTIHRVKVTKPTFFGVRVYGDGNTFTESLVSRAGDTGVEVTGSGNTFQDNKATGSANLDHHDLAGEGANAYIDNVFGTSQIDT